MCVYLFMFVKLALITTLLHKCPYLLFNVHAQHTCSMLAKYKLLAHYTLACSVAKAFTRSCTQVRCVQLFTKLKCIVLHTSAKCKLFLYVNMHKILPIILCVLHNAYNCVCALFCCAVCAVLRTSARCAFIAHLAHNKHIY